MHIAWYVAKAGYLITGNHTDFSIVEFEGIRIISQKKYELYKQNNL